ncbi:hypothetical protein FH972_022236 [Carpinus fangiana]|uniref:Uncharacterized protein n=1 Tax=Carpinus fangiana TaxID=176857 RepID=A0A5N6KS69_9ROSI|nr:hypothetical protein FH972_022236 [Carpinus fangiana]
MTMAASLVSLALALAASAHAAQPSAPSPKAAPLRNLQWGQLNFLHTTDTHGWHGGHLQEPSYSADWGDYISFAHHMHQMADKEGVDLLLIDTGDRVEGNGLYDSSKPKGKYTFDIFKQQDIDVLCSGNHELYKQSSSENEFYKSVPNFKGNYLASNIDIHNPDTDKFEPLARRWRKFTTKNQGIRVTAFGFLFNFQGNYNNTRVQPVQDTIKEKWFQDAIRDKETDLFLVVGHVAIRSEEYDALFSAIRGEQWDTPIQFFGGHTHIRDYKKYDKKSVALESGRYMETIGFMSIDGLNTGGKNKSSVARANPTFHRRYIDNNLFSFYHHSQTNSTSFPTERGTNVTKAITSARSAMNLDDTLGCAPQDFWISRARVNDSSSIFQWLGNKVIPDQLNGDTGSTKSNPKLVISNTGAMRFDIFKGPFTKDSEFLVSPFTSGFRYIKDVDYSVASRVLDVLNSGDQMLKNLDPKLDTTMLSPPEQLSVTVKDTRSLDSNSLSQWKHSLESALHADGLQSPLSKPSDLTPGYTTVDDDGDQGDDTLHSPISFYRVPNCIQSSIGFDPKNGTTPEKVDVVYNAFVEPWIILALKFLGGSYEAKDTLDYMGGVTQTKVIADWVKKNWPCEKD